MGPKGMEPLTGRGAGYCAGCKIPGFMSSNFKRGIWIRQGRGLFRRMFWLAGLFPGRGYFAYQWARRNRVRK